MSYQLIFIKKSTSLRKSSVRETSPLGSKYNADMPAKSKKYASDLNLSP